VPASARLQTSNSQPMSAPKSNAREPWIIRTYAGFGDARQANARFHRNLKEGQRGLSIAFDLPTQNGYDPDAALAAGEVGRAGVSICHLRDMEELLEGISLDQINTSMTINATAPFVLALYLALADKQGIPWTKLRGTTQNDLMKEFVARGTSIFTPDVSFRLSTELIHFAVERVPNWNPINCCGYHYMESGAGPAEEIGYTFGNALILLDALRSQLTPAAFQSTVRRISFFINSGIELVPEICKVRAYSTLWRELCRSEYGIDGVAFRAGCQVRSLSLSEQQPEINIIRIAYEALPVVISADHRVNALQLPGFREAMALPDEVEQLIGLRTQQVLMHETGIANYGDIFDGSHVIEKLTDEIATAARKIAMRLRAVGYSEAISVVSTELTRLLAERQRKLETGEMIWVGVNAFKGDLGLSRSRQPNETIDYSRLEQSRIESMRQWRASRDDQAIARARERLHQTAAGTGDTMDATLELARVGGTVGEWTATIERATKGRYVPPVLQQGTTVTRFNVPKVHRRIRIALGKAGLDGHINAIKLLAHACMQAGMEVILAGFKQTPQQLVEAAIQEDAEVLAISSLAGAHLTIAREVITLLRQHKATGIKVLFGGIIPAEDHKLLLELGVTEVFTPKDFDLGQIVQRIAAICSDQPPN
jgi:(2R)-ethylmalonyl-CoA mutase